MPQGEDHAPTTPEEQLEADRLAGWDTTRYGPAPFEHGLPVDPLDISDTPPTGGA